MTLRKWTNRTGRALAALGLATVALLLAACSAGGGSPVTGSAGGTARVTRGWPGVRARRGRTADGPPGGDSVDPGVPRTLHPALRPPLRTTAALPGPGQAVSPSVVAPAGSRVVTFVNRVSQTIWVAASPDAAHPLAATGWVLPACQSVSIVVPDHYNGRFWGRTGCVFSGGHGHCQTGTATACSSAPGTARSRPRWPSTTSTPLTAWTSTTCPWSTARTCRCGSTPPRAAPRTR